MKCNPLLTARSKKNNSKMAEFYLIFVRMIYDIRLDDQSRGKTPLPWNLVKTSKCWTQSNCKSVKCQKYSPDKNSHTITVYFVKTTKRDNYHTNKQKSRV